MGAAVAVVHVVGRWDLREVVHAFGPEYVGVAAAVEVVEASPFFQFFPEPPAERRVSDCLCALLVIARVLHAVVD